MGRAVRLIAVIVGVFLVARAIAEPFVIGVNDPASYAADWGGPSLVGVLIVHCGPGLVAAVLMAMAWARRRQRVRP